MVFQRKSSSAFHSFGNPIAFSISNPRCRKIINCCVNSMGCLSYFIVIKTKSHRGTHPRRGVVGIIEYKGTNQFSICKRSGRKYVSFFLVYHVDMNENLINALSLRSEYTKAEKTIVKAIIDDTDYLLKHVFAQLKTLLDFQYSYHTLLNIQQDVFQKMNSYSSCLSSFLVIILQCRLCGLELIRPFGKILSQSGTNNI